MIPPHLQNKFFQTDGTTPKMWWTVTIHWLFTQVEDLSLSLSHNRPDRMKIVRSHMIPIILLNTKNILVDLMFKTTVGHTNLEANPEQTLQQFAFWLTLMPTWLGTHFPGWNVFCELLLDILVIV